MIQAQALIERVRRVSATIQRLDLAVDSLQKNISAGQLFLARTTDSLDPYLREPWTPIRVNGATVTVERPGVQSFSPGDVVSLLGPIGKPIPMRETVRTLLLIAYESAPTSLLMLAETALSKGASVALVLLGSAVHYPLDALPQQIEVVRGDRDGIWANMLETFRWADQVVAVAPPPHDMTYYGQLIQTVRKERIQLAHDYVYGLLQPPLPCGIGACQACLVRCGKDEIAACLEGPAFDLLALNALSEAKG